MQTFSTISKSKAKRAAGSFFSRRKCAPFFRPMIQPKLSIGPVDDPYEREADALANKVMQMGDTETIQTKPSAVDETSMGNEMIAPPVVQDAINSGGRSLDTDTRNFMESRLGYDFGNVQIHNDSLAHQSSEDIEALAYTQGNHIVFGNGQYQPDTPNGKHLLAHELAHVTQQSSMIRPYRKKTAFNFGKLDDATLIEDSFNYRKDKETKPWIQLVTVEFTSTVTDAYNSNYWKGTASVQYYDNPVKWRDFTFAVSGGSRELGKTDKGNNFKVKRIEGVGYNSGSYSGRAGVDYDPANREGPSKKYSKDLAGNMSFAVFYNGGEALHAGPLDQSSHGCVHVDWSDFSTIKQLNYHSVIDHTKVKVKYP